MCADDWLSRLAQLASPYSLLADAYDDIVGRNFFHLIRRAFESIIARHRIDFSSVADLGCGTGLFARYLNALWHVPVFAIDAPANVRPVDPVANHGEFFIVKAKTALDRA